ncbi:hypothetical protein EVAR_5676_1 [Eumeta japonica]|uniref:Uncharacterized protein n=1 Tax=Eumeta variegata TaxID=151549 RepID=A0A4C1T845_EUMVA|nr:hypothetical protein EVAR_5676_1 [Eumeta japonica]
MAENRNAVAKKEGSGRVTPAHWITRRQFRAAEFHRSFSQIGHQSQSCAASASHTQLCANACRTFAPPFGRANGPKGPPKTPLSTRDDASIYCSRGHLAPKRPVWCQGPAAGRKKTNYNVRSTSKSRAELGSEKSGIAVGIEIKTHMGVENGTRIESGTGIQMKNVIKIKGAIGLKIDNGIGALFNGIWELK